MTHILKTHGQRHSAPPMQCASTFTCFIQAIIADSSTRIIAGFLSSEVAASANTSMDGRGNTTLFWGDHSCVWQRCNAGFCHSYLYKSAGDLHGSQQAVHQVEQLVCTNGHIVVHTKKREIHLLRDKFEMFQREF